MEKKINPAAELEEQVAAIIGNFRKEAYAFIDEMMWNAFEEVGKLLDAKEDSCEYAYVMSRRSINGISCNTLHEIVRIFEKGGDFEEVDKNHKAVFITEFLKTRSIAFDATRARYPNYLKQWTEKDDDKLKKLWDSGLSGNRIAMQMGRNTGAVKIRMSKLGL